MTGDGLNQVWNTPVDEGCNNHQRDTPNHIDKDLGNPLEDLIRGNSHHTKDNTDNHGNSKGEQGQGNSNPETLQQLLVVVLDETDNGCFISLLLLAFLVFGQVLVDNLVILARLNQGS